VDEDGNAGIVSRAFSGKVDTGFPPENATTQKPRPLTGSIEPVSALVGKLFERKL
jgi:hypothetical protein